MQNLIAWFVLIGLVGTARAVTTQPAGEWRNPIVKKGYLHSPVCEASPFVFGEKLYRLESWQKYWELPGLPPPGTRFQEDCVRVCDVETNEVVSVALTGHGFASPFVWGNRVYVFSSRYGEVKKATEIEMTSSDDLVHWTAPVVAVRAEAGETLYNCSVCRGKDGFVLLYETDDPKFVPFTFKFCGSSDLRTWTRLPDAIYGKDKYVGGPGIYFSGGWYYLLYLADLGGKWETRITRSKNLVHWEEAPAGRAFLTPDYSHDHLPLRAASIKECNASDADLCAWRGKTFIYFTGSDQQYAGDLQWAEFDGSPGELLEYFFK